MRCSNVQSTNFGMAYRIGGNKADYIRHMNQQSLPVVTELNAQMKKAIEALGTEKQSATKFADVESYIANDKLFHNVYYRYPYLDNDGSVVYKKTKGTIIYEKLDDAVKEALNMEKNLTEVDAQKKEQSKLIAQASQTAK